MTFSMLRWRAISSEKLYHCSTDMEQKVLKMTTSLSFMFTDAVELQWRRLTSQDRICVKRIKRVWKQLILAAGAQENVGQCTKLQKGMIHALIVRFHHLYQFPTFKLRLYITNGPPNPCASVAFWNLVGLISSPFCENNMSQTGQSCCSECLARMVCNQTYMLRQWWRFGMVKQWKDRCHPDCFSSW